MRQAIGLGGALLSALLLQPGAVAAQQSTPTRVMIRVVAHDAKIIGTHVKGARVTVRNARTGEILDQGVETGGTGDTKKLIQEPRTRGEAIYDTEGAAGFMAHLNLDRPTVVRIEAEGPLDPPSATRTASRTLLLVPGQDVLGNGIVLELYGFRVELLAPTAGGSVSAGSSLPVRARVTMLCGCSTEPGGLWDSNDYTIQARIVRDGRVLRKADLAYAGETSTYEGTIQVPSGDGLSLQVVAMDPSKGNFGMAELPLGGAR